jgi:drug/metabolite transporter (DMT)-like permease
MTAIAPTDRPVAPAHSERTLGVGAVLSATIFWSFGSIFGKLADVQGVTLGFWRMWIATGLMTLVVLVTRRIPSLDDLRRASVLGVLFGLNIVAFFITLEHTTVLIALIIGSLTPVVALPIAVLFMGERLTWVKGLCAAAATAGVVAAVLSAPPTDDGSNSLEGYLWAVASLLIWVVYLLANKRVRAHVETVRLMWVLSFVGAITVSVIALVVHPDLGEMQGKDWLWVVLLSIGPGILGHGLLSWAQPRVDSSVSSVLIQAEPVGATFWAWLFLDEDVSTTQIAAMAVVVVALAVLAYSEARGQVIVVDEALG